MPSKAPPLPPLPRDWKRRRKSALIHAVALERLALLQVRAELENSPDPRAALVATLDRAREEIALLREQQRILRARMARIPPAERPQYPRVERMAIVQLREKRGWTAAQTARCFQIAAGTVKSWVRRLDENGPDALLETPVPINRIDDQVTAVVHTLHQISPTAGRRRIAALLARLGIDISASSAQRMLRRTPPPLRAPEPQPEPPEPPEPKPQQRRIVARRPHHVWHIDITAVPTCPIGGGFWTLWYPLAMLLGWPISWQIALVLDHFSRSLVGFAVLAQQPSAADVCALLERSVRFAGQAPNYVISDRGCQFQTDYRDWCAKHRVRVRYGAVGRHGSIAVIERFILSLKNEFLRLIFLPLSLPKMEAALASYQRWYNEFRPHAFLGGRTPAEVRDGCVRTPEGIETRARVPLARDGPDGAEPPMPHRRLELLVSHVGGFAELPVFELRQAA
jgi:transposase InsO family protein